MQRTAILLAALMTLGVAAQAQDQVVKIGHVA